MKISSLPRLLLILLVIFSLSACASEDIKEEPADISIEENNGEMAKGKENIQDSKDEAPLKDTNPQEESTPDLEKSSETMEAVEKPTEEKVEKPAQVPANSKIKEEPPEKDPLTEESKVENALKIQGNIGKELVLTLEELKNMSDIIFEDEFYSLNNFGTTEHNLFKGVKLWSLLEEKAQISKDATQVAIVATDGYKMEFTIDQVKKQDYMDETSPDKKFPMIIAWEENGQEYDSGEGPPYKLIMGQIEAGDVNKPQWVSNIDKIIVE